MPDVNAQQLMVGAQQLLPLLVENALHLLTAILIVIIGFWVAGRVDAMTVNALRRTHRVDEMLQGFFGSIARYGVLTLTLLAVLAQFGIQTASLVAVIGAASLAIGLALQGTLSHMAAGVMLLIFRLIRVGQRVQVGANDGTVKQLSLFWTELVTLDNVQVIIPNGAVWGQPLRNFSIYPMPPALTELRIPLSETTDLKAARDKLQSIVDAHPRVLRDPPPTALLDRGGPENTPQVVVSFLAEGEEAGAKLVRSDLVLAAHDALNGLSATPTEMPR